MISRGSGQAIQLPDEEQIEFPSAGILHHPDVLRTFRVLPTVSLVNVLLVEPPSGSFNEPQELRVYLLLTS